MENIKKPKTKRKLNYTSIKNLLIIFFTVSIFSYLITTAYASIECSNRCYSATDWIENNMLKHGLFNRKDRFLCRMTGWKYFCYDKALEQDPVKLSLMEQYEKNGVNFYYTPYFKILNSEELKYYCLNTPEMQFNSNDKPACPSTLRGIYWDGRSANTLDTCKDIQKSNTVVYSITQCTGPGRPKIPFRFG